MLHKCKKFICFVILNTVGGFSGSKYKTSFLLEAIISEMSLSVCCYFISHQTLHVAGLLFVYNFLKKYSIWEWYNHCYFYVVHQKHFQKTNMLFDNSNIHTILQIFCKEDDLVEYSMLKFISCKENT